MLRVENNVKKVVGWLFYLVIFVVFVLFVVWYLMEDLNSVILFLIIILIIVCLYVFGLVIFLVIFRSISIGSVNGVLVKDR